MANSYQQLRRKLTFDELMRFLDAQFQTIPTTAPAMPGSRWVMS
jgi:hypothetical protein